MTSATIVQINSRPTLIDYLNDPTAADKAFKKLSDGTGSTKLQAELNQLTGRLDDNQISTISADIAAGDSNLSLNKLKNMRDFYEHRVAEELQELASQHGVNLPVNITNNDGSWTVDDLTGSEQAGITKLQNYLNRDERLSKQLETLAQLSSTVELNQARENANALKKQDVSDEAIVDYLQTTRDTVFTEKTLHISRDGVTSNTLNLANKLYDALK
ncbi:hypothetical protein [Alteromonas gilva]|uniref:Uncharacterized protein n=1 Tax=Alteromonas gilva TaxID=2987522 RepID=A0ABT5L2B0_9ALTE|nr:hypothetical protein [Alteromonas gilva]MDC8831013.1 hypothetical protein [Alteromonas gilva]